MVRELRIGNYNNAFAVLINNHSIEAKICTEFLIKYVLYGITAAKEIGESVHSCDDVMASGFDWAPPLSVIEAFGGVYEFKKLAYKHLGNQLEDSFDLNILLEDIPSSNYDYRPFFKAKWKIYVLIKGDFMKKVYVLGGAQTDFDGTGAKKGKG